MVSRRSHFLDRWAPTFVDCHLFWKDKLRCSPEKHETPPKKRSLRLAEHVPIWPWTVSSPSEPLCGVLKLRNECLILNSSSSSSCNCDLPLRSPSFTLDFTHRPVKHVRYKRCNSPWWKRWGTETAISAQAPLR